MADEEQLARLLRSVEEWNEWRRKNVDVEINLFQANLSDANLVNANLSDTNLINANLSCANLVEANLRIANLSSANLVEANLGDASLRGINLFQANLSDASINSANLFSANLFSANLTKTNFSETNLSHANLSYANLINANLIQTQALYTNFEGATLTGACIQDWNINSYTNLDSVICEYVYLDFFRQDRRPHDPHRIFAPREFSRLFQTVQDSLSLYFPSGLDWQAFSNSFQALKTEQIKVEGSDRTFSVRAIENLDDGSFVVRINTPKDADKAEIERSFRAKYDAELKQLEGVYRRELQAKDREIDIYKRENTNLWELAKLGATRPINVEAKAMAEQNQEKDSKRIKIDIGTVYGSANTEGDTNVNVNPVQNLASAAKDIQDLLDRLEKSNPTTTTDEQMAVATEAIKQIESHSPLRQRAIAAAKEGLMGGLKKTLIGSVVAGAIEGWTKTPQNPKS